MIFAETIKIKQKKGYALIFKSLYPQVLLKRRNINFIELNMGSLFR